MGIKVKAPGSCGELVQGTISGQNFLITCPIDLFSEVELHPGAGYRRQAGEKVLEAIQRTYSYLGLSATDYGVTVNSELPVGKGMASSSADISAACQAAALLAGKSLTPDEIADIALAIEPTDGVFYPGIIAFDHVSGTLRQNIGEPPLLYIAVFDAGGEIDTVCFNQRKDLAELNRAKESVVREAFELVVRGIAEKDGTLIGKGATLSALANQAILYKPCLETVIRISEEYYAAGVNVAHSGTVFGILFSPAQETRIAECIEAILCSCPEIVYLQTVRLISGGLIIEEGEKR